MKFNNQVKQYIQENRLRSLALAGLMAASPFAAQDTQAAPKKIEQYIGGEVVGEEVLVVAKTLWAEARGEGEKGMRCVASVIWERAKHNPKNVAEVCLRPKQFSVWNDREDIIVSNKDKQSDLYKVALKISKEMLTNKFTPQRFTHTIKTPKKINGVVQKDAKGKTIYDIEQIPFSANAYVTVKLYNSPEVQTNSKLKWIKVNKNNIREPKEIVGNHIFMRTHQ